MFPSTRLEEHRASNGIFYRIEGEGEPLLLLHGLMVSGAMYGPLVELLRGRFRMLIPDLRGHGRSGSLEGPYDVAALAADVDTVLAEAGFDGCAVMGYSHGGAVAQQLTHTRPSAVRKLILTCTYACNASTLREYLEASVLVALLRFISPATIARTFVRPSKPKPTGMIGLTKSKPSGCGCYSPAIELRLCGALRKGLSHLTAVPGSRKYKCQRSLLEGRTTLPYRATISMPS